MMAARSRSEAERNHVGSARTVAAHAHVERPIEAERKAALRLIELHRGHAEVEHDAVDGGKPTAFHNRFQFRKAILDQFEAALRLRHEIGAARDRALVAIDTDDACSRRREDQARVAAGAEGGVDIDAAGTDTEQLDGAAAEHGNVTGQSASDSFCFAVAARRHSRAPSGFGAATGVPSSCFMARTLSVASTSSARKRPGSQILKFVSETDEDDCLHDSRMRFVRLAQDDTALAVDLERFAGAIERKRELLALIGIRRVVADQRLDLGQQRIAAGVDRRPIQRRMAVQAVEAIAGEHRAERRRYRNAALGVEAKRVVRDKAIHRGAFATRYGR